MLSSLILSLFHSENSKNYRRYTGETLSITFKLDPGSCNIYFIPEGIDEDRGTFIVRRGWLDYNRNNLDCPGFEQSQPCGIVSMNLDTSCSGRYQVQDNNGNTALAVHLEVECKSFVCVKIVVGSLAELPSYLRTLESSCIAEISNLKSCGSI